MKPDVFLDLIRGLVNEAVRKSLASGAVAEFKLGVIPANYVSGRPAVTFDGESAPSTKTYPYASSYVPAANDRVLLARVGSTWVVICKIV